MANMLDQIGAAVYKGLKGKLDKATFHTVRTDPVSGLDTLGDAVSKKVTEYSCEAFRDEYSDHARVTVGIPETNYKVCILGGSLSIVPLRDDEILIRGAWSRIVMVTKDPATALWICQAYAIPGPTIGC